MTDHFGILNEKSKKEFEVQSQGTFFWWGGPLRLMSTPTVTLSEINMLPLKTEMKLKGEDAPFFFKFPANAYFLCYL